MQKIKLILLCISLVISGLHAQDIASKVRIKLSEEVGLKELSALGLDVTEGNIESGAVFETVLLADELQRLSTSGVSYEVLIQDMQKWYLAHRNDVLEMRGASCSSAPIYLSHLVPKQFKLGSLGGYLSYQEMKDELLLMHSSYPDFTSELKTIEGYTSIEGRPIYWYKITAPGGKKKKKQVLYTALHHAREPGSMLQLIYFMWYVLERYPQDEAIRTLLDNVELYFIPCVNPDGFLYNQSKNPSGGGYWRKNRRSRDGWTYGVDLNRNYPYKWGLDETGSSSDPSSGIYRGSAPASEPETQAVIAFCNKHDFKVALNAHTFSALLIYPWGYSYGLSPDSTAFNFIGQSLTKENNYIHGNSRIIYTVNGEADDWMYGDSSKPKIYSMTPEVGRNGFWAPKSVLIPDCKAMLWTNIGAGLTPLPLAHFIGEDSKITRDQQASFHYELANSGLQKGNFIVHFKPISNNITITSPMEFFNLEASSSKRGVCRYEVQPGTHNGEDIEIEITVDNGYYKQKYTWKSIFIQTTPLLDEDFSTLDRWESSSSRTWGLTQESYTSSEFSLADSPYELFDTSVFAEILTKPGLLHIPDNTSGLIWTYKTKWFFPRSPESFVQPVLYVNGERKNGICGKYTKDPLGLADDYSYYGYQERWVNEQFDLSDYIKPGDEIQVGFEFFSYSGYYYPHTFDGIYIDDMQLYTIDQTILSNQPQNSSKIGFDLSPNPTGSMTYVHCNSHSNAEMWTVRNAMGHILYSGHCPVKLDVENWPEGIYFITRYEMVGPPQTKRFVVIH